MFYCAVDGLFTVYIIQKLVIPSAECQSCVFVVDQRCEECAIADGSAYRPGFTEYLGSVDGLWIFRRRKVADTDRCGS